LRENRTAAQSSDEAINHDEVTVKEALGRLLREWRAARQLSLNQLAARAGVAKSTVSTWETGTHRPRLAELAAVLAALGATEAQREQVLVLIGAPRAVRLLQAEMERPGEDESVSAPTIASGELLRAMRCRRGFTLEQVAAALGVRPSTICRWEQGESTPPPERRETLFELLGAAAEERAALADGHWVFPHHAAEAAGLEPIEAEAAALRARVSSGKRALMDLELLALEARLWRLVRFHPAAHGLLQRVWADHATWLSWDDRKPEAARYAERVLAPVRDDPRLDRALLGAVSHAVQVSALVVGHRPLERAPHRAVELLRQWLPLTEEPLWAAGIYRDMADHAARGGETAAALEFSRRALQASEATDDQEARRLCRHVHADTLLRAGRPAEAHAFLAADSDIYPIRRILETLQRVSALLALEERAEAHDALNQAYALIETYHYPNFRRSADALAEQF